MNIKNYLHLYLGCDIRILSIDKRVVEKYELNEDYFFENSILPLTEWILFLNYMCHSLGLDFKIKPILRQLNDISDEEKQKAVIEIYAGGSHWNEISNAVSEFDEQSTSNVNFFHYLLLKHFDLFGLIDAGLAIDATTMPNND